MFLGEPAVTGSRLVDPARVTPREPHPFLSNPAYVLPAPGGVSRRLD